MNRHSSSYKKSCDKMIHLLVWHLVMYDEYLYLSVDGWCEEEGWKEHVSYSILLLRKWIQWGKIDSNSQRPTQHSEVDDKKIEQHERWWDMVRIIFFLALCAYFLVSLMHVCKTTFIAIKNGLKLLCRGYPYCIPVVVSVFCYAALCHLLICKFSVILLYYLCLG